MNETNKSTFVTRYWLAIAIGATVVIAWAAPGPASYLTELHLLDIGVVLIMFLGSLKLTPSRFKAAALRPHLIGLAVVATFVLAPLVSLGMAYLFGFDDGQGRIAVLISTAQASTLATAIVLTEVAGGDVALAMVITVVNNFATVVLTPLVFRFLGHTSIEVDYTDMGLEIALKIVLPVIVAQIVRPWLTDFTKRHSRKMSVTSQLVILMYIYAGVSAGLERLTTQGTVLPQIIAMVVALHFTLLLMNAVISRLTMRTAGERTAYILCASQKTLPAAILIWKSYFPGLPLGPIVAVAYHLVQLVVDSVLAPGFKRLPIIKDSK